MAKKLTPQLEPEARLRPEYNEGKTAWRRGLHEDENPYHGSKQAKKRISWFAGYFDARTEWNVGRHLRENGATWP